jgi:hypothetical protein
MRDVDLDGTSAMRQAGMTATDYLSKAYDILKQDYDGWSVGDAIELAKVMAQDFHTSMMCMKMQEIRDAVQELKDSYTDKLLKMVDDE